MSTNKKRACVDGDQHESPPVKKQKLNAKNIDYAKLSILSTEKKDPTWPMGKIRFDIMECNAVSKLASFEAKWDSEYKRIDFEDTNDFDNYDLNEQDENSDDDRLCIRRFFSIHSNANYSTESIQHIFFKLIKYIFDYKNNRFSTIVFPSHFIEEHKIKFPNDYHHPYIIDDKYYFLRVTAPNILFNHDNIETYECTLIIKDNRAKYITNKTDCKQTIKNTMKLKQKLWNSIDCILDTIMDYIPDYEKDHVLEFDRKCMILKNDGQTYVYFDFPIILIGNGCCDIPFKLRINDMYITGSSFFFDSYNDRDFRVNKYSCPYNIDWFYISDKPIQVNHCLGTRYQESPSDCYGYISFANTIGKSELQITDVSEDNLSSWDDEMIDALEKLESKK